MFKDPVYGDILNRQCVVRYPNTSYTCEMVLASRFNLTTLERFREILDNTWVIYTYTNLTSYRTINGTMTQ